MQTHPHVPVQADRFQPNRRSFDRPATPRALWTLAGRFTVLQSLESQAGGQVFEARDLRTDEEVRLFVARASADEQAALAVTTAPEHAHLVGPVELGTWGGFRFCILAPEVQPSLRSVLELVDGTLPAEHVVKMGHQACLGLAALHHAGFAHGALTTGVLRVDPWSFETRVAGWSFRLPLLPHDCAADLRTLGAILYRAHTGDVPHAAEPDLQGASDLLALLGRMMRGDSPPDAATLAGWFSRLG